MSLLTPSLPSPCSARLAIQSNFQGEGGFLEEEGGGEATAFLLKPNPLSAMNPRGKVCLSAERGQGVRRKPRSRQPQWVAPSCAKLQRSAVIYRTLSAVLCGTRSAVPFGTPSVVSRTAGGCRSGG